MSAREVSPESLAEIHQGLPIATDLDLLKASGKPLPPKELKELNAKVKALEEMSRITNRLRALKHKRPSTKDP